MDSLKGEIVKRALRLGLIWRPGLLEVLKEKRPHVLVELSEIEDKLKDARDRGDREECIELLNRWEKLFIEAIKGLYD